MMNIETTTVYGDYSEYLRFGWVYKGEKSVGNARNRSTKHELERNKDIRNYEKIASLESEYFSLKKQIKFYNPVDPTTAVLLFLCLIFPLFIYLAVKSSQKNSFEEKNNLIRAKMNQIMKEAQQLRTI